MLKAIKKSNLKILRLYGRTHEQMDFPNPLEEVFKLLEPDMQVDSICKQELKRDALHQKIRKKNPELTKIESDIRSLIFGKKVIPPKQIREK